MTDKIGFHVIPDENSRHLPKGKSAWPLKEWQGWQRVIPLPVVALYIEIGCQAKHNPIGSKDGYAYLSLDQAWVNHKTFFF